MSIKKSLAWSFSQQFIGMGVQFAGSLVIARLLTPKELGIFALAMAASALLGAFRSFGVGSYLITEKDLTEDKIRTSFGVWILMSWLFGAVFLLSRDWIAGLYGEPGIADVMLLVSVSFFIMPFGQPAITLLYREMRMDLVHHINIASIVIGTVLTLVLAFQGFSYMSQAWGLVASSVVLSLGAIAARPDHLKLMPSLKLWREVFGFGGYLTVASFANTLNAEGSKFILGGVISTESVSYADRATQMPKMSRLLIDKPAERILFPAISENLREKRDVDVHVLKLIGFQTATMWPLFLSLCFISHPFILILFGDQWGIVADVLPWFLLAGIIQVALPEPELTLVASQQVKKLCLLRFVGTASNIIITVSTALFGFYVFSAFRPLEALIFIALNYFTCRAVWKIAGPRLIAVYGQSALLAVIACLPSAALFLLYRETPPYAALAVAFFASAGLWFAGLYAVRHVLWDDTATLFRQGYALGLRLLRPGA